VKFVERKSMNVDIIHYTKFEVLIIHIF